MVKILTWNIAELVGLGLLAALIPHAQTHVQRMADTQGLSVGRDRAHQVDLVEVLLQQRHFPFPDHAIVYTKTKKVANVNTFQFNMTILV